MSETTASEVGPTHFAGEVPVDPAARSAALETARLETDGGAPSDPEATLEVDVEALEVPAPAMGFQAFLQNANLHNLLQIESLSRTTGVFEVLSRGRRGYLHLAQGELIHAELGTLVGEAAAFEILAWNEGEFETSARPLGAASISASLQTLLLQLAQGQDEAVESVRRPPLVRSRQPEDDKPTEPHLPAPPVESQAQPAVSQAQPTVSQAQPAVSQAQPVVSQPLPPPRSSRLPPPLPPRIEREPANLADVVLSPSGELLQSRGTAPDELAARVAYAARLAELIGRAIRSGAPRGLELRGKGTHTRVKWQADGSLVASLELVQSPKMR